MALHLQRLLSVELHNAGDAESVEFVFDDGAVHQLSRSPDGRGIFYKFFDQPLTFARLSVSVRRPRQPSSDKPFTITCDAVASKLQGNEFRCRWNSRLIIFKVVPQCIPVGVPSPSESMSTDSGSLQIGPRYRILIFGQTGVGKSSLINQVLGREAARVENDRSGKADINKELTSPENDRFILHDSQGFEPAESDNHKVVKAFIERRKMMRNLRDQLHAVWLCFQVTIPTHGERPLEEHAEIFLKEAKIILGNIPVIVVFTKYDRLLTFMRAKRKGKDPEQEAAQYLKTNCIDAIRNVSGDQNILHVEFSCEI
ncbi:P-loop containing nucleoside triphosphate hydrolase protein [Pisolithus croceorrhizus]|nr:P-loop containing nucleoside triphosphate hydrolase protein [Pisolithus croceorrhizus]